MNVRLNGITALNGITVNNAPVQTWLDSKLPAELKSLHRETLDDMRRTKARPVARIKVQQQYDTAPGRVKQYDKYEVMMENLKEAYLTKEDEIRREAAMDAPNKSKLIIGVLCQEEYQTINEICQRINEIAASGIKPNGVSAVISNLKNPKKGKPIRKLVEISYKDGSNAYRIFPPACKLSLDKLHQLSLAKGYGTYSLRDAMQEIPEIGTYLALIDSEEKKLRETGEADLENILDEEEPEEGEKGSKDFKEASSGFLEKNIREFLERQARQDAETGQAMYKKLFHKFTQPDPDSIAGQETVLKVKVEFGPIKVLFGWDKD